jgi:cytidine deaminase
VKPAIGAVDIEALVARALEAQKHAYAPYSGYAVGCAILADGAIHTGANMENASYGLALCAERGAVSAAVFSGARQLDAAVVATSSSPPAAPCGMCLQTLNEFAADPSALPVVLVNQAGERREFSLAQLLPHGFRGADLPAAPRAPKKRGEG